MSGLPPAAGDGRSRYDRERVLAEDERGRERGGLLEDWPDLGCHVAPAPGWGEGLWLVVAVPKDLEYRVTDEKGREVRRKRDA
jgi:hypothetical protein